MRVSAIGIPLIGAVVVAMGHLFFGVTCWMGAIAIPLVFVFTIIAVNSTGLTSITPIGAMGKLTQLTYGAIAPGNMTTNLMTAGHHRRGGQLRLEPAHGHQARLHAGRQAAAAGRRPRAGHHGRRAGGGAGLLPDLPGRRDPVRAGASWSLPAAQVWKAVAELLAKGFGSMHPSARWAMLVGAVLGIVFEWANLRTKGRFPLSGVGLGLASVVPFPDCLSMSLGRALLLVAGPAHQGPEGLRPPGLGGEPRDPLRRHHRRRGAHRHHPDPAGDTLL